ncbi:uncharacterized protein EV420DRAFT_1638634 [Desarmillaria tabescens]|uniref:WW domain-containing protein n=1 Tax=Armillaria tabescens TaxID=1929756 RepID=A0AA39TUA1_ARMTA|nr:uncharacterized protein EV420DRAFT_1638634 [Desarmillaria tabescens]KAK0463709.1 hypothetical protein EV420DRAFT_1638634 [Desarmillaria tabescens]
MSSASTSSTFKSSLPQTEWRWIRQILIEAVLLSSAIKLHLLPSPVWMIWVASSPSRHASQSLPRPLPSRPVLSRMILKVASDQLIDESSPPLSRALAGAMARPHLDTVLLRRSQRLLYQVPHWQMNQSLLPLRTKPGPWGIRPSHCDKFYFSETSSSLIGTDDYTKSPFASVFPTSYINSFAFQFLQSPFSDNEVRNAAVRVAKSSQSVVLLQGSAVESASVSHCDVHSFSKISSSRGVGSIDPDVASNIPHIVISGDTSPSRESTGQVAESSELTVLPQSSTLACTDDWSRDEKEFQECLPCGISHYARKSYIDELAIAKFTVPAMQTEFSTCISPQTGEEKVLPEGWTKHTHSDGKPYFYHDNDKVITEEWLYDRAIAEKLSRYISILNDAISKRAESFGRIKSWHLYVEIVEYEEPSWEGDNCCRCRYYFVNHDEECIFWLSEFRLDDHLWELRGDMSPDFIRKFLEYWSHQYFFSDIHRLTKVQWNAVKDYDLLAKADVNMSDTSTVTWSIDKLKNMSKNIIIAETSYMMALLHNQILNYYDQRNVRTNRNESTSGSDHNKELTQIISFFEPQLTVSFKIANILLFYAPIKHYTLLNKVWDDRMLMDQRTVLVEQTISKLNLSNGLATVLLAVNVAFLAIPSVDNMGANQQFSVTKILVCFSVVLSLGSIIIGLFFIHQYTTLKQVDSSVVISFLERHWQMKLGFERLAIISSVPDALLMWGPNVKFRITSFLVSFLSMCFEAPNAPSLKAFVILAYVLITALGLWCTFFFWEGSDQWIDRFFKLMFQRDLFSDRKNSLRFISSFSEKLRRFPLELELADGLAGEKQHFAHGHQRRMVDQKALESLFSITDL